MSYKQAGRTRAFDEATVLTGAMEAFRRHGYGGVSVRDLEVATGISSGSIYNAYADKHGLFDAAFRHYHRTVLVGRLDTHAPPEAGLSGLRDAFTTLLDEPGGGSFGCLITNSAVELADRPGPAGLVQQSLAVLRDVFTQRLQAAHEQGLLPTSVDPATAALHLLALYQGLLVLIRSGYDRTSLHDLITAHFDVLEGPHVP
ncbi:TetR/AcrR family transcriptional regulator [Nocardioides sp.]|uniref:TetR/AcrR family transcriptional regulator n=1 Tax=Nocardioides sp. TaxID=35761 RepID=UPI002C03B8FA|nr:TetR/AcrR family transcriptional regulator [Nocardioides sp.]HXH80655.1 TetR/AcrR family transcriptional regulator [Nocardioides sp.]